MPNELSPACVFHTHAEAEAAVHLLSRAGFDIKKLSLVGKGYHTEEHPVRFYKARDRIKAWGSAGAFLGSIWGLLLASVVSVLPGPGLIATVGPVVSTLVCALEGAVVVGGLFAIFAAFIHGGVANDRVIVFETALQFDEYVLVVHGGTDDIAKVRSALAHSTVQFAAAPETIPA